MSQVVQLSEVTAEHRGSALVATASIAATTLTVEYAGDFDNDGGILDLNGTQLAYLSVTEGTLPDDPDVINLAAGLAVAGAIGDIVGVVAGGQVMTDYWAVCSHEDGDSVMVPITDQQILVYPPGVYDPPAPLLVSDDLQRLESAPGRTPVLDGALIEPGTVPIADGNPPASSPAASVSGGIGTLFVKFDPITNYDPVTYEIHMSTSSGFAPGPGTLVAETPGTTVVIRKTAAGADMVYGTTYYVKILAKDVDGPAPAYGTQGSAQMVKINTPDIGVNAITANEINSNAITAGKIDTDAVTSTKIKGDAIDGKTITGAKLRTAASGERLEIQSTGAVNSPGQVAYYTADINEDPAKPAGLFGDSGIVGSVRGLFIRLIGSGLLNDSASPVAGYSPPFVDVTSFWDSAADVATSNIDVEADSISVGNSTSGHDDLIGSWVAYTPAFTAATTNPVLGTGGTILGWYQKLGKTVRVRIQVTWGSTGLSVGSGTYLFSLPSGLSPVRSTFASPGTGLCRDSSVPAAVPRFVNFATTTTIRLLDSAGVTVTHNNTYTWASGDTIVADLQYEVA